MSIQIPTQATAPHEQDSRLFNKSWYVYFSMMAQRLNALFNAGGDLSGIYPDPSVIALQGNAVSDAAPADGNVLTWVAADSKWEPQASGSAAWTVYTPTTTNLTFVSKDAVYNKAGKTCSLNIKIVGTSNGSNPTITLPFNANDGARVTFACYVSTGGATVAGVAVVSATTITVSLYNNTALAAASVYTFVVAGVYETT